MKIIIFIHKMFHKILILTIMMMTLNSCNTNYLNSADELDFLNTKLELTLEDKSILYPAWNIEIRDIGNESTRAFTAKEKEITLRIMSIIRFVLNTPEYEERIINATLRASENKNSQTTSEKVRIGDLLDSERVLRTVQRTLLTTTIYYANLNPSVVGLGVVPSYYPYFEDPNNENYDSIISNHNRGIWLKLSSLYNFNDTLNSYANIGNTILHESIHNLGFSHAVSEGDVPYSLGDTFAQVLKDKDFLEKYKDEFRKIIPYFEEKYKDFIKDSPVVTQSKRASSNTYDTYISKPDYNGETFTVIECVIEEHEKYSKPFKYLVRNGLRIEDNFILK